METAKKALSIHGNKLYQERARKALPILVRQAKASEKIFYEDLAEELGMPNPRNLNYPLGSIGKTLQEIGKSWKEKIPPIQCLVVNKNTGLPGEGISGFISYKNEFKKASTKKKEALVKLVLAEISDYHRWDSVLKYLGLEPASIPESVIQEIEKSVLSKKGSGGEGIEHKKLKPKKICRPVISWMFLLRANVAGLALRLNQKYPMRVIFKEGFISVSSIRQ